MKDLFYEALKDTRNKVFAEVQNPYNSRLHFHRAFEIAYVINGRSEYEIEDTHVIAEENDIIFINRYYRHRGFAKNEHQKFVVAVPENLAHDITDILGNKSLPYLLSDKEFNKSLLSNFNSLVNTTDSTPQLLTKGHVNVIFGSLFEHYEKVDTLPKGKNVSIISDILAFIDENYSKPLSLEVLATNFGYNKSYFSRLFNSQLGMSLNSYVNFVRLDHFEEKQKAESTVSITDLAHEVGFSSLATYYRTRDCRKKQSAKVEVLT